MGAGAAPSRVPSGSTWLVDEQGTALKATWRLNHGFINLSLWRNDRCVETFHLAPSDAAHFISFLVSGLAEVATVDVAAPVVRLTREPTQPRRSEVMRQRLLRLDGRLRSSAAGSLRRAADRLTR